MSEADVESEILLLPLNKASGLYSFPSKLLKLARHYISKPIANLMNHSVQLGIIPLS